MKYYGFSLGGAYNGKPHIQALSDCIELAEVADRLNIDGWFFVEHHLDPALSLTPSPNLMIATLARRTQNLRLGNMVNVLPYHNPLRVAEEIRVLDALTGGRIEVGFGRGQMRADQAAFGVKRRETVAMFDASIDIVRRLLNGERVSYDTSWWRADGAFVALEATQAPMPPMWLALGSDSSVEKAACLGLNGGTSLLTRAVADARMSRYREYWDRYNPDRKGEGRFAISLPVCVADTHEQAIANVRTDFERRKARFAQSLHDQPGLDDETYLSHKPNYEKFATLTLESLIDEHLLIAGTVDECREQVAAIRDRGIDVIMCYFHNSYGSLSVSRRSLELFSSEVIPYVESIQTGAGKRRVTVA